MVRSFPLAPSMSRLLWACTLGVAIAAEQVTVDDADTDKISYSDGWVHCPGSNVVCESALKTGSVLNNTVHQYV